MSDVRCVYLTKLPTDPMFCVDSIGNMVKYQGCYYQSEPGEQIFSSLFLFTHPGDEDELATAGCRGDFPATRCGKEQSGCLVTRQIAARSVCLERRCGTIQAPAADR